jgi:AraC family transcriptional regulator of adaptative response / DNA-3-methyladenine glycosylase II
LRRPPRNPPARVGGLNADQCYQAIISGDQRFDGRFYTGIVTTGVYCRPICPVRPARRAQLQFRDEGVLRLFLADALPREDQIALVRRLRGRAHTAAVHMRSEIVPLAEALEEGGTRYPAIVARLGADTYAYAERWLARLEAELGDERLND